MMRLLCTAIGAAFFAFVAQADEIEEGKDWRNCSMDEQCVLIEGLCGKTAVNWQVKDKAEAFYAQEREKTKCVKNFWTPSDRVARCHLGGCDTRPMQPSDAAAKK